MGTAHELERKENSKTFRAVSLFFLIFFLVGVVRVMSMRYIGVVLCVRLCILSF